MYVVLFVVLAFHTQDAPTKTVTRGSRRRANSESNSGRYHQPATMKWLKSILALGAFFVLVAGLSACGSGVPGDAVVQVAGNPISTKAFDHWMFVAAKGSTAQSPGAPVIVPSDPPQFKSCIAQVRAQVPTFAKGKKDAQIQAACKQLFTSLSGQVLDFLIRAYWYQASAYKMHIKVTDAQVQQAFNNAKKQQFPTETAFQSFLSSSGQTLQDIMFRVRVNQIYTKLLAKHRGTVTPAQIQAYYNAHPSQFGTPEKRDIRIIRTNKLAQAKAAKRALKRGRSWTVVAKKYSVDATTKSRGGLLPGVTKGQQEHALDTAAFSVAMNKVVGPIHGQFGYYVFEVTRIITPTKQSLAKATPLIRQILTGQTQTNAQTAVDNQAKKDWLKKTKCRSDFAMADCSGYKAPKTSSSATPPAQTSTTP
jgi:foldase protein PrsA